MTSLSRKDWILLILLTLTWGINWPIMKIAVLDFPPLTFRALSMAIGLATMLLVARAQRISLALPPGKLREVVKLALPNMLMWHVFIILGVRMLSSGRAAILGYTMPVWAVLSALVFRGEWPTRAGWFGIACAMVGALLLLSREFAAIAGQPLGTVLVLIGAAGWGYGTVLMRNSRIDLPPFPLTFWMLLVAAPMIAVLAALFEAPAWRLPNAAEWGAILFNGFIIFGAVQAVWSMLARNLPPIASSLSVMMVPVLGVFSGAWLLGEVPHWQDYAAMLLIVAAMASVLLKPRTIALNK